MKIWTTEHVFGHSWESVVKGQWQKYPNPHNQAVLGTDVVDRRVDSAGVLHSHRIISSDWGLADWVQRLVGLGSNRPCHAHEYSEVDPAKRTMRMTTVNLDFCHLVSMREVMSYSPHPEDPANKTVLKQEMVVTVQGVPLTSYMESLILGTVTANASKGRNAMEWVVDKLSSESKNLTQSLNNLKLEMADLTHQVEDRLIQTARKSIDELQAEISRIPNVPMVIHAEEAKKRIENGVQTGEKHQGNKDQQSAESRRHFDSDSLVKQAYLFNSK